MRSSSCGFSKCSASAAAPNIPATRVSSVSAAAGAGAHEAPAAQHRHRVGEVEHLVEEVAHVDDRPTARAQGTDHPVQRLGLDAGQRRGRLVHHDHARIARDRAQDLDLLLVGGAQRPDLGVSVELEAPL